jgi:hypothetical protein
MSKLKFKFPIWTKVKQLWIGYKIKRLKREADRLSERTGAQIFIVKIQGKMTFLSKPCFKEMRQRGMFPKDFTAENLKKISYYYTCRQ